MSQAKRLFASIESSQAALHHENDPLIHTMESPKRIRLSGEPAISSRGHTPLFSPNATLILVGIRGSGKSTMAVIASSATKRKLIEMDAVFQRATGSTCAAFREQHGLPQCQQKQASLLEDTLKRNPEGCTIECPWIEPSVQETLQAFLPYHPIIHIIQDIKAIHSHLKDSDNGTLNSIVHAAHSFFRDCTNFDFYNVFDAPAVPNKDAGPELSFDGRLSVPSLTLKKAEAHFLSFLARVLPSGSIRHIHSAYPLAAIPLETRPFTYAVSLQLEDVLADTFNVQDHISGVDAIQIESRALADADIVWTDEVLSSLASTHCKAIGIVRRTSLLPIILHIAPPTNLDQRSVLAYSKLIALAARSEPEMMTIDLRLDDSNITALITARGRSRFLGDYHAPSNPPRWDAPQWLSHYMRARRVGCDMARFVRPALCTEDNLSVNQLRLSVKSLKGPRIPLIAYNSGMLGRTSACFNPTLTLVSSSGNTRRADEEKPLQPCITALEATKALAACFVYDAMKLYVWGGNVSYSLAPALHNAGLEACGIPYQYEIYSTDSLAEIRRLAEDPLFGGASVVQPFKVEIMSLTQRLSRHAQAIGAVNTLIPARQLDESGNTLGIEDIIGSLNMAGPVKGLYGENTDWIGIKACIKRGLSPANAVRPTTCGLILGSGGMARAALYAMLQAGVQNIVIYNRTVVNGKQLVQHFRDLLQKDEYQDLGGGPDTKFHVMESLEASWPSEFKLPTIIISCIPSKQACGSDSAAFPGLKVPESWLGSRNGGVVIDPDYKTLDTPLLSQARRAESKGWVAMNGLDSLPGQCYAQFELFTRRKAPVVAMRNAMYRAYAVAHNKPMSETR